ncbi:hypothetical protein Ndes2526B_g02288 [Nannochloris sp. 'desiccata']
MAPLGNQAGPACCTMQPPLSWLPEASTNPEIPSKNPSYSTSPSSIDDWPASGSKPHFTPPSAKSARRRAAEALLERKASKQRLDPLENAQSIPLRSFVVDSCDRACACPHSNISNRATAGNDSLPWCSLKVTMPSLNWPAILTAIGASKTNLSGELPRQIPGGVAVHVVETHTALIPALAALRSSMQDGVVAIDLEWRPDYRAGSNNRVALMQLASGSTCVLIRCCLLGHSFPAALRHLFSDPSLTFVSFSWDSSDEMKMKSTFGVGKDCFARFFRLATDALVTGSVFRGLRLWHASPSPCTACRQPFGVEMAAGLGSLTSMVCRECNKNCRHMHGLLSHLKDTGHNGGALLCDECGRVSVCKVVEATLGN